MAALQTTTTASMCTPKTARGKHVFNITGYSLHKGLGVGKFIRSTKFAVGGYDWCLRYYPDGENTDNANGYISVFVELLTKYTDVRAGFDLRLVTPTTTTTTAAAAVRLRPSVFTSVNPTWGYPDFKKRSVLETSSYLRDDRLVIECEVTVIKKPRVRATSPYFEVQVPPSDLSKNLAKLLEERDEPDVTFNVEGEVFRAHKLVLAMRSPVFKAEPYGPMRDKSRGTITIEDMQPAVFKALLQFIYTDSMPSMDDLDGDEKKEMVKHLLVAADRYAMERMKLICEGILCKSLDTKTVANTLALADQHHCSKLKDACIEFMMSSNKIDGVLTSQGYAHLKRFCPAIFVDLFEKVISRKI